jgi:hypothetical protein
VSYNLYTFETLKPIQDVTGKCSSKIGIAKNLDSRNGDYQQAVGPDYPFQFEATWAGDEKEIRWLEREVLKHFKVKRCAEIRSLSEWIKDTRSQEVIQFVEETIKLKRLSISRID